MDERTKKFGAFERFLIEQPKASVILMCSFVGVLVLTVELLFWPRMNDDPAFYWAMRYISLLTIPGVFIAVYNLNQENLSRWGSDITNSWDQKVVNLLARKHPFFVPTVFSIVVGIWSAVSDSMSVLLSNSPFRLGTLLFVGIAFVFSFVTCYIWLRMITSMRTELITSELN